MKLELKKFDITKITDDKVVVMIGKRNTGKSFLIRDLLYHHTDLPIGTVISGTESANHFYGNMVPKVLIHDEYKAPIIDNAVKRQKMILKKIHFSNNKIKTKVSQMLRYIALALFAVSTEALSLK